MDIAGFRDPFILLLLLTFGLLLGLLGAFLLVFSRGKPRMYGGGFLAGGIAVLAGTVMAVWSGNILPGVATIMDVVIPGLIYFLAIALGAALAVFPFLVVAIRT